MRNSTKELLKYIGIGGILILTMGLACMHSCNVWDECRTEGHSIPYCISLISH